MLLRQVMWDQRHLPRWLTALECAGYAIFMLAGDPQGIGYRAGGYSGRLFEVSRYAAVSAEIFRNRRAGRQATDVSSAQPHDERSMSGC